MILDLFAGVLLPILLMIASGVVLRRCFTLDLQTLVKINIYLFVPVFVFDRVATSQMAWADMGGIVLATCIFVTILGLITYAVCRTGRADRATTSAVLLAVTMYNSGNYGLPLAELAFPAGSGGVDGGAVQSFVLLTMNVLTFTVGIPLAAGSQKTSFKEIFRRTFALPIPYALFAAFAVKIYSGGDAAVLPDWLVKTSAYLAGGLVPVALVTLGAQLATSPRWPKFKPISVVLMLRLVASPALMAALLWLLHLALPGSILDLWTSSSSTAHVLILTTAVPTAVNTLLLTLEMNGDARLSADAVFWTTALSPITVLAVVWLVK